MHNIQRCGSGFFVNILVGASALIPIPVFSCSQWWEGPVYRSLPLPYEEGRNFCYI